MGNYSIHITNEFDKQIKQLPNKDQELIHKKIDHLMINQLKEEPHFGKNVKKLRNFEPPTWRYRIGNYRIFYHILEDENEVYLLTIKHRKDAY